MENKSSLERDIELQEMYVIPLSTKIIILLLVVILGVAGAYAFKLKQELSRKEQEMTTMKESFQKEKVKLVGKVKRLEADIEALSSKKRKGFPEFRDQALQK
jgi:Tfp pilus assembly protein PilO